MASMRVMQLMYVRFTLASSKVIYLLYKNTFEFLPQNTRRGQRCINSAPWHVNRSLIVLKKYTICMLALFFQVYYFYLEGGSDVTRSLSNTLRVLDIPQQFLKQSQFQRLNRPSEWP